MRDMPEGIATSRFVSSVNLFSKTWIYESDNMRFNRQNEKEIAFLILSFMTAIPTLLAQQNGQNSTTSVNTNQSNGCSKPISYYQPCECTDWGDGNIRLDCDDKNLGNAKVSRILKDFLSDPVAAKLRSLWLANNQLTRVPPEIANLIHLQHVDLAYNMIHTIHKGDFNFGPKTSGGSLDLRYNELSHIEDGAFQGTIGDKTYLKLDNNNLTRLESGTFHDILAKIRTFGGYLFTFISMDSNPIDCDTDHCHIAWLIRDKRYLLKAVEATCSNGTHFYELDPNGYANCSSKSTEGQLKNDSDEYQNEIVSYESLNSVFCPDGAISPCVCENYGLESNSGMIALHCGDRDLTDDQVSDILQIFLSNSNTSSRLVLIDLPRNRLTQIPKQIRHFKQLSKLDLSGNKITSIKSGDFNFTTSMNDSRLLLYGNAISDIEPNSFLGNYKNGFKVLLMNNQLRQLDANVFKYPLDQIASNRQNVDYAHFRFENNPLECDPCNMSWLLRDNRHLIRQNFVLGTCMTSEGAVRQLETVKLDDFICPSDSLNNGLDTKMIVTIASIATAVFAILFLIGIYYKYQKKKKTFKSVERLLKGNLGAINRNQTLDEQVEFLPYDPKWEFPKSRLRFGAELGSGAFGRVIQAEAIGIDKQKQVTTVAVKMVRTQMNKVAALEALICEMKVMIHLGKHLNIVNLLGACTKHISKGEVFVIVEYCRYGNLLSYLMAHRQNFVNEVSESGNLNGYVAAEDCNKAIVNKITIQSVDFNYIVAEGSSVQIETNDAQLGQSNAAYIDDGVESYDYGNAEKSQRKENIYMSELLKTENIIEGNQLQQQNEQAEDQQQPPEWSINYKTDEANGQIISLSTRELIYWSFQIARGMDYLSSKKVIHGDLAARNVLLTSDGIVKVADFGLSRRLYHDDNYMKQSQEKLPVKWMAIESLTEMVFSSQSDVWSFGIVLWELFSLGKTPYPGMGLNQLIRELQSGYRMDKPQFATNDIGQLMSDCWKANPSERPTFHNLQEALSNQLEYSVNGHYMQMKDDYLTLDGINNICPSTTPHAPTEENQNKSSIWHDFIRRKKPKPSNEVA